MNVNRTVLEKVKSGLQERNSGLEPVPPGHPGWEAFYNDLQAEHPDLWRELLLGIRTAPSHQAVQQKEGRRRDAWRTFKAWLGMEVDPSSGQVVPSRPKLLVPVVAVGVLLLGLTLYNVFRPIHSQTLLTATVTPVRSLTEPVDQPPAPNKAPLPQPDPSSVNRAKSPAKPPPHPAKPGAQPQQKLQVGPPQPPIEDNPQPILIQQPRPNLPGNYRPATSRPVAPPIPTPPLQETSSLPSPPADSLVAPRPSSHTLAQSSVSDPFTLISLESSEISEATPAPQGASNGSAGHDELGDPFTLVPEPSGPEAQSSSPAALIQVGHFYQGVLLSDVVLTQGGKMLAVLSSGTTVWQGEAALGPSGRVEIALKRVTLGGHTYPVEGSVYGLSGERRTPGLGADYADQAPSLVADAVRAAMGGVSKWVDLKNNASTLTVSNGTVISTPSDPDLLANIGGSLADLIKIPQNQTALVRVASVAQGTPVHLFVSAFGGVQ